jgi:hypothetical protein
MTVTRDAGRRSAARQLCSHHDPLSTTASRYRRRAQPQSRRARQCPQTRQRLLSCGCSSSSAEVRESAKRAVPQAGWPEPAERPCDDVCPAQRERLPPRLPPQPGLSQGSSYVRNGVIRQCAAVVRRIQKAHIQHLAAFAAALALTILAAFAAASRAIRCVRRVCCNMW